MGFITSTYAFFLLIVVVIYFSLPIRFRNILLGIASLIFYGFWNFSYLILMLFTIIVSFITGIYLDSKQHLSPSMRHYVLGISLILNFGILFVFKYFNFFSISITSAASLIGIESDPFLIDVLLPVGISFYTFQAVAYTVDVFRAQISAETNLILFTTFISFFPQLVAGPIERAKDLLPQFHEQHSLEYKNIVSGLQLILWGVFKKVVIADQLAIYVDSVYNGVEFQTGARLVLATIFFTYQIYCDFSGYSDIAVGSARILGFDLMTNFRQPYLAISLRDFWRRWHISLSTWFRDYVYVPLGGNRVPQLRIYINLLVVFVVSGLWHGAAWTFVIWGGVHGLWLVLEDVIEQLKPKSLPEMPLLRWAVTFIVVIISWIFFRANTLNDALYIITHIFDFSKGFSDLTEPFGPDTISPRFTLIMTFASIGFLMIIEWLNTHSNRLVYRWLLRIPRPLRWSIYYAAIILIVLSFGRRSVEFIYFQF